MSDYKLQQDWLMGELEAQQKQYEQKELASTIALVDSKLRTRIVFVMRQHKALTSLSAKECFDRWKGGYMAQRAGALKVLEEARKLRELDLEPDPGF